MPTAEVNRLFLGVHWSISSGHNWHFGGNSSLSGSHLITHLLHDLRGRTDEPHARINDSLRKVMALRQETVARVNGIDVVLLAHTNDLGNAQVSLHWCQPLAHDVGLVGLLTVHMHFVLLRVDGHRLDAQLIASAEDANGNLATIRHQDGPNGLVLDLGGVRVLVERRRPQTFLGPLQGAKSSPYSAERHLGLRYF